MKPSALLLPAGLLAIAYAFAQSPPAKAKWTKQVVSKDFLSEGLGAGDIDGDGVKDLVAGAFWFKGPDFKEMKQYRPGAATTIEAYMSRPPEK